MPQTEKEAPQEVVSPVLVPVTKEAGGVDVTVEGEAPHIDLCLSSIQTTIGQSVTLQTTIAGNLSQIVYCTY